LHSDAHTVTPQDSSNAASVLNLDQGYLLLFLYLFFIFWNLTQSLFYFYNELNSINSNQTEYMIDVVINGSG